MDKDAELLQVYGAARPSRCRNAQWGQRIAAGKDGILAPEKARPNWREPLQLAAFRVPDAPCTSVIGWQWLGVRSSD